MYKMPLEPSFTESESAAFRDCLSELMRCLKDNSERKTIRTKRGTIEYQEFYPRPTKSILDRIDGLFARHFGFTDEELDFIINYDIKYRMGRNGGEAEED
ncbi:MAG: hypothetical protein R6W99_03460 [Clostridia bacterium]